MKTALLFRLLTTPGSYLLPRRSTTGRDMVCMYDQSGNPIQTFSRSSADYSAVRPILKTDRHGRATINRSLLRALHGNDRRKIIYKKLYQT